MSTARLITKEQARRALLSHQGLWPPRSMRGWPDASAFFARVGSMQFDPVDVAGISPEISLCARVRGFQRRHLGDWLYKQRFLCDVWDKNACVARVEDNPYLLAHSMGVDWGWRVRNRDQDGVGAVPAVREKLRTEGPLSTAAFQKDPAMREALAHMVKTGEVGIHHREGRRRFFDLTLKLMPEEACRPVAWTQSEQADWLALRRIGAVGFLWNKRSDALLGMNLSPEEKREAFERLAADGRIVPMQVEGIGETLYMRAGDADMLEAPEKPAKAALLGPLDNLLWDRILIEKLFGFTYRWEIYIPDEKRQYGSYTIPMLYGDRFIGRTQLSNTNGELAVRRWWAEEGVKPTKAMQCEAHAALAAHAGMLGSNYQPIDLW